jgi:putative transposase
MFIAHRRDPGLPKYPIPHALGTEAFPRISSGPFSYFQLLSPTAKFRKLASRAVFESALERVRQKHVLCVYGYVVMPEHVHLLVNEPERGTLAQAMQSLEQGVARRLALRAADSFWQVRYYDFNIWSERKFVERLRHIHRNPVKRGLVGRPEDWTWSSFYLSGEAGPVEIESQWTARKREQDGIVPMVTLRPPAENTRPGGAWTGHPRE